MRCFHIIAAATLALAAGAASAAGTVQVNFVQPEKFSDVRDSYLNAERHLELIKQLIENAAAPYLADGQTLKVDVLDVDLAGEVRPGSRPFDVRVLKGRADWPRIDLRYALEAGGQTLRSATAHVQDMAYLQHISTYGNSEPLPYERRMLEDWFKTEFKR